MSSLYTIIVTYNSMKWIDKCIQCLENSSIHTEIVVVDNKSNDNTVSHIASSYPDVHLIKNENNKGFGQANNQGIEYAYKKGATHFFLCNQDLYVRPDALEKLVEIQDRYSLYVVSPMQMNGTFELVDQSFYNSCLHNNISFVSNLINEHLLDYYEIKYAPAAAWVLSRDCIEKIGGFDPLFFHYGEDVNYLHRVVYHQMKIGVVPDALVAHDRIFKGNVAAFKKYSHLAILLSLHSNPAYKPLEINRQRVTYHMVFVRDILKSFVTLKFKNGVSLLSDYFTFWLSIRKVKRSVNTNRMINNNWLNI